MGVFLTSEVIPAHKAESVMGRNVKYRYVILNEKDTTAVWESEPRGFKYLDARSFKSRDVCQHHARPFKPQSKVSFRRFLKLLAMNGRNVKYRYIILNEKDNTAVCPPPHHFLSLSLSTNDYFLLTTHY